MAKYIITDKYGNELHETITRERAETYIRGLEHAGYKGLKIKVKRESKNPRDIHIDIGAHNVRSNQVKKNPVNKYKYSIVQVDRSKSTHISNDVCLVKEKTIAYQIANCLNRFAANNIVFKVK